jgi:Peptidase C26
LVEWELMREAYTRSIPILSVCRGAQFVCVFSGGKLVQDCKGHYSGHGITTYDGLSMHAPANHHQMMMPVEGTYDLLAWAEKPMAIDMQDGWCKPAEGHLIDQKLDPEVIWFRDVKGLAIQPHPEWGPQNSKFNEWVLTQIEHFFFQSVKV